MPDFDTEIEAFRSRRARSSVRSKKGRAGSRTRKSKPKSRRGAGSRRRAGSRRAASRGRRSPRRGRRCEEEEEEAEELFALATESKSAFPAASASAPNLNVTFGQNEEFKMEPFSAFPSPVGVPSKALDASMAGEREEFRRSTKRSKSKSPKKINKWTRLVKRVCREKDCDVECAIREIKKYRNDSRHPYHYVKKASTRKSPRTRRSPARRHRC